MTRAQLYNSILKKKSFLCVGLDTDIKKIPSHLMDFADPCLEFNKRVIDATMEYCVAYKPNLAFYESRGSAGWETLQKTLEYIPDSHFTIADAKRGDIGNTSKMYARTFFEFLDFDAVTVAPYMGYDSVTPFLEFEDRWVIILGLTSNAGNRDFQMVKCGGEALFEKVIRVSSEWGSAENMMFVAGATHPEYIRRIRQIVPDHFLLVPGVGSQGGDLTEVCTAGINDQIGLLVNSSRSIIYAGGTAGDFTQYVRAAASDLQAEMAGQLHDQIS